MMNKKVPLDVPNEVKRFADDFETLKIIDD